MKRESSKAHSNFHEELKDRSEVKVGSERSFGIIFAIVFLILGLLPLIGSKPPLYWSFTIAVVFLVLAFVAPAVLAPLNRAWFKFGLLLHRIVSPIMMGLLFYLVVTPTGLVMRLFQKDMLRLRYDRNAESYWIKRDSGESDASSYKNQF